MTEHPKSSKSDYLQPMIFTTSVLLFLMVWGMGIGALGSQLPEIVKTGKMSLAAAWAAGIAGGVSMAGLAAYVAFIALKFLDLVGRDAKRRAPSDPTAPLPPLRRKPNLHVVSSESNAV
jgi:hypothetical protein